MAIFVVFESQAYEVKKNGCAQGKCNEGQTGISEKNYK